MFLNKNNFNSKNYEKYDDDDDEENLQDAQISVISKVDKQNNGQDDMKKTVDFDINSQFQIFSQSSWTNKKKILQSQHQPSGKLMQRSMLNQENQYNQDMDENQVKEKYSKSAIFLLLIQWSNIIKQSQENQDGEYQHQYVIESSPVTLNKSNNNTKQQQQQDNQEEELKENPHLDFIQFDDCDESGSGEDEKEAVVCIMDEQDKSNKSKPQEQQIKQNVDNEKEKNVQNETPQQQEQPQENQQQELPVENLENKNDLPEEQQQQTHRPRKLPYPPPWDPTPLAEKEIRQFLMSPVKKNGMLQCIIKREKALLSKDKYHMFLSSNFQHLMSATQHNQSSYVIGQDRKENTEGGLNYLGKVSGNLMKTEFNLYDNGDKKNKTRPRQQIGLVLYETNFLGQKGPRKMKVLLPSVNEIDNNMYTYTQGQIQTCLKQNNFDSLKIFVNRPPKWNDIVKAYVLNFYGRVDKPSVKNFQLVEYEGEDSIALQFGRVGDNLFNIDFQYPLSPLQAFQICLSSFGYKVACE